MSSVSLIASKDDSETTALNYSLSITNHVVQGHKGPQSEKLQKRVASYDRQSNASVSEKLGGVGRDPHNGEPTDRLGRRDLAREAPFCKLRTVWRG